MPARGSVGSAFVASTKATEELKAKIAGLETQLTEKIKEQEERTSETQKEREEMIERYVSFGSKADLSHDAALEAIKLQVQESEEKAKAVLEEQVSSIALAIAGVDL